MSKVTRVLLLACLLCACGRGGDEGKQNAPPRAANAPAPAPTATARANTDPPAGPSSAMGKAKFNRFALAFEREGERATARFTPTPLPRTDSAVVGAARVVILEAFGEKMEGFPRPVAWEFEGRTVQAIKLGGNHYDYIFWPVREDAEVVRRVEFWRVAKSSVE
ncbi:MAG TPA: hypothetical protein VER08_10390 [Pyrinomonadaceae bacterium]|nr:hypothetical protein [Pyrinomonadaceae bacterium]